MPRLVAVNVLPTPPFPAPTTQILAAIEITPKKYEFIVSNSLRLLMHEYKGVKWFSNLKFFQQDRCDKLVFQESKPSDNRLCLWLLTKFVSIWDQRIFHMQYIRR